uniref:Uncharacterized protein n=1 Tax=Physcomitrium patens TaxID=3218 RepID=A0A2K1IU13_PHYPA|nr:hypothetical protein PHYPA_024704 [Physcomitrium patens]
MAIFSLVFKHGSSSKDGLRPRSRQLWISVETHCTDTVQTCLQTLESVAFSSGSNIEEKNLDAKG